MILWLSSTRLQSRRWARVCVDPEVLSTRVGKQLAWPAASWQRHGARERRVSAGHGTPGTGSVGPAFPRRGAKAYGLRSTHRPCGPPRSHREVCTPEHSAVDAWHTGRACDAEAQRCRHPATRFLFRLAIFPKCETQNSCI
jgi:hypothetical protein